MTGSGSSISSAPLQEIGQGVDPHARLFIDGDRILRAIHPAHAQWFGDLLEKPAVRELMERGTLIPTKRSETKIEGYPLVLEHPRLPFVNYPFEWTPSMFKAAALTTLEAQRRLRKDGCLIHDPHAWNIMFAGVTPRFIDFTSIVPISEKVERAGSAEFERYFADPLRLMSKGFPTAARAMLRENLGPPDTGLPRSFIIDERQYRRTPFVRRESRRVFDALRYCAGQAATAIRNRLADRGLGGESYDIERFQEEIAAMDVKPPMGHWSEYYAGRNALPVYDGSRASLERVRASTPKHQLIDRILAASRPATVLDMGCNTGLYSHMAGTHGIRAVGVDTDEYALDSMYESAVAAGMPMMPCFGNVLAPSEAISFALKPMPRFIERYRADLVLCLALVHHLLFSRVQLPFAHIAELLSLYARRELLVEFIPPDDAPMRSVYPNLPEWYSLEGFEAALRPYFPQIERHESFPAPRILLHCRRGA